MGLLRDFLMGSLYILETRLPFRRGKYGNVDIIDYGTWTQKGREYKAPTNRRLIYKKAWKYYCEHGFGRPIANLKASAEFGKGIHWSGDNEQVAFAKKLFDQLDLFQVGLESGLYGDTFIRWFKGQNGGEHKIAIIPPETIDKETKESNVLEVEKYIQYKGNSDLEETIEPNEMIHIMANAVSNSKFGNSDFKHLFYYFDLYNSLVEGADKRRLFFSSPIGKLMGIDLRFKSTIKTTIGKRTRDVDQKTGIRSSLPPGSMIMLPKGADYDFAEPKGKFDLETMILRVARTIATASNTPLHWLNLAEDVNRACYSEDTETLTERGWKKYDEIGENEKIATYNPETGKLEYHVPTDRYVYDHEGEMIHFQNKNIDVLVTPEHKMYAKRERNDSNKEKYELIKAEDMTANRFKFLQSMSWEYTGDYISEFVLPAISTGQSRAAYPEEHILMDRWVEFLGYFISEGHAHKGNYSVSLSQKDPVKAERIKDCLFRLPFTFSDFIDSDGCHRFVTNDKGLNVWLRENCGEKAGTKRLPDFYVNLSISQLRILFEALMLGDGSVDKRPGRNCSCYYTSSKILMGQMQEITLKLGYRSKPRSGKRCLRLLIKSGTESLVGQHAITTVPYKGKVYCFEVPNHLFITRRNGKIGIHSNTAREMQFPFIKEVLRRQKLYSRKFEKLLRFIYDDDSAAFPFDKDKNSDGKFQLRALFPPIFDYDLDDIERMVKAILAINMQGNLSGQTILDLICNYFGLDVEEEQKRLKQEEKKGEEDKYTPVEKAVREIGKAVADKEITKKVGTKLIKKLSGV